MEKEINEAFLKNKKIILKCLNCEHTEELKNILSMLLELKFWTYGYTYWEENNCEESLNWLRNLIYDMEEMQTKGA